MDANHRTIRHGVSPPTAPPRTTTLTTVSTIDTVRSDHIQKKGADTEEKAEQRDYAPGYTPAPLQWWYLYAVLGYIVFLFAILEYSFHIIPQTSTRQTSPPQYFKTPSQFEVRSGGSPISDSSAAVRQRNDTAIVGAPFPNSNTTTGGFQNMTITPGNQTGWNSSSSAPLPFGPGFRTLHMDPGAFAQLEPRSFVAHYRLHFVWVHDAGGRFYVPAYPSMDISQRCTSYVQYMYMTDSKDDCQMLVDRAPDSTSYGFTPLYEEGDRCHKEWMDFQSVYGSQGGFAPHISDNEWNIAACWEAEWDDQTTYLYPSRSVSWPPGWSSDSGPTPAPKTTITTTLAPTTSVFATTTTGADGKPTVSMVTSRIPSRVITTVLDVFPTNPADFITVDGTVITQTDSLGRPTATITSFARPDLAAGPISPVAISQRQTVITTTLTDSAGRPTATSTLTLPVSGAAIDDDGILATVRTFYDEHSSPVATQTQYLVPYTPAPIPPNWDPNVDISDLPNTIRVDPLTWQAYFAGSFAPVLLTTLLSILVQILNGGLRAMIPFWALSRPGSTATDSLLLPLEGNILRVDIPVRLACKFHEPLLLLSNLLQVLGMVLASLSSEAIGMTLGGGCREESFEGCYMSLAVVKGPARAAEGILLTMAVVLGLVMGGLYWQRKRTRMLLGMRYNPTSILGVMAMIAGQESQPVRELMATQIGQRVGDQLGGKKQIVIPDCDLAACFTGYKFTMSPHGQIVLASHDIPKPNTTRSHYRFLSRHSTKIMFEHALNLLFLLVLAALLFIVAYYGSAQLGRDNPLEHFLDSQTFGVSFLFTFSGGLIDFFWGGFFSRTFSPSFPISYSPKYLLISILQEPSSSSPTAPFHPTPPRIPASCPGLDPRAYSAVYSAPSCTEISSSLRLPSPDYFPNSYPSC